MEVLLKFQYENKWYFVEKDNKDIKYYTINDNNQKDYNLNSSEIELIKSVLVKVIPSNDRIKLVDFQYKNNTYEIFLDKKNNYYLFNPKPNYKDFIELNYLFNNMNEYVFSGERLPMPDEDGSLIKRIINFGKKFLIVYISAELLFISTYFIIDAQNDKYNRTQYESHVTSMEYTQSLPNQEVIDTITNAVNNNSNLTDEEKTKMLDHLTPYLIIENKKYMDIKYFEEVFENIKIKYVEEPDKRFTGSYNHITNTIEFYGVSKLDDVEETTFTHELFHALEKYSPNDYNSFLVETTNTIFNEEYTERIDNNTYRNYYNFTKALMEIIGSEPLKQYHNYTSIKPIVDSLCEITGNEDDAVRLLNNLAIYKKIYDNEPDYIIEGDRETNLENTKKEIIDQLGNYYSTKYNMSYEDDLVMLFYLDEEKFKEKLEKRLDLPKEYDFNITNNNRINYFNKMDNRTGIKVWVHKRNLEIFNGNYYDMEGNKITKEEYETIFNALKEQEIENFEEKKFNNKMYLEREARKTEHKRTKYDGKYYDENGQVISKYDFYEKYYLLEDNTYNHRRDYSSDIEFIIDNTNRYLNTNNKIQEENEQENQSHIYFH